MPLVRFRRPDLWAWPSFDDQLTNLRDEINRLFENPSGTLARYSEFLNVWSPAVDLYEDNDHLTVQVELPGMKKEDIDVSLHNGALNISGERKAGERAGEVTRTERYFGRFQRSIDLPKKVDGAKVQASYQDGILTIRLPKAEDAKPRQITVEAK